MQYIDQVIGDIITNNEKVNIIDKNYEIRSGVNYNGVFTLQVTFSSAQLWNQLAEDNLIFRNTVISPEIHVILLKEGGDGFVERLPKIEFIKCIFDLNYKLCEILDLKDLKEAVIFTIPFRNSVDCVFIYKDMIVTTDDIYDFARSLQ